VPEIDPNELKAYSYLVFSKLEGAVTSAMVYLGHALGLYRALGAADGPVTTTELAASAGLHERWVREWAANQAAAKLIGWTDDGASGRYTMSAAAVAVLSDPDHPAFGMGMFARLPDTMAHMSLLLDSFRTGVGYDYDAHGPNGAAGIEESFAPWYRNFLVPVALPALDGVVDKLERGAVVADIGCGGGLAISLMAKRFPNSTFHGFDISKHALALAETKRAEMGLTNAWFHDVRVEPITASAPYDFITTFDCIHDMTHPTEMMATIRGALTSDGTWLLVDIKGRDTLAENLAKNPVAALMYGMSVMSCMSSGLSQPDGEGLGTLGLPASRAVAMATDAGFTQFRKVPIDHATNSFFEIRP
jgi:2-polyprenyl-3-methyl-5-hydroxy-6-metoxy-1,4-benzoquinol methylase